MIEVRQQVAQGTKQALNMYKVYRDGKYMGWLTRGNNSKFNPYREYTDAERKEILAAVNEYMRDNGYPPITRYGSHGLTVAQVSSLIEQAGLTTEETDE